VDIFILISSPLCHFIPLYTNQISYSFTETMFHKPRSERTINYFSNQPVGYSLIHYTVCTCWQCDKMFVCCAVCIISMFGRRAWPGTVTGARGEGRGGGWDSCWRNRWVCLAAGGREGGGGVFTSCRRNGVDLWLEYLAQWYHLRCLRTNNEAENNVNVMTTRTSE
jgi:hypothetical protein